MRFTSVQNDDDDDESDDNLVDQPHEVSIGPAGLVQVVRLLQHLGQLLAPNIPKQHICQPSKSLVLKFEIFWRLLDFWLWQTQTTSGFPRIWQLWSEHALISIWIQSTKKGLFLQHFRRIAFVGFSLGPSPPGREDVSKFVCLTRYNVRLSHFH